MIAFKFVRWQLLWLNKTIVHNIERHYDVWFPMQCSILLVQLETQMVALCHIN